VQRESFTKLPYFPASGIKGAMRDYFEREAKKHNIGHEQIRDVFGPPPGPDAAEHAGAMALVDAKVLLFPVRSLYGVFAYLTCPLVLQRLLRDLEIANIDDGLLKDLRSIVPSLKIANNEALVIANAEGHSSLIAMQEQDGSWAAVFEEYRFVAKPEEKATRIAQLIRDHCFPIKGVYAEWRKSLPLRFAIVPDDVFVDFTILGADVITRNRIDDNTGTVDPEKGNLWTEEHLPSETVLYSLVLCGKPFKCRGLKDDEDVRGFIRNGLKTNGKEFIIKGLNDNRLQLGGVQSVGRGIVMVHFMKQK
jgi:CRISPR-associated protein Cmr4